MRQMYRAWTTWAIRGGGGIVNEVSKTELSENSVWREEIAVAFKTFVRNPTFPDSLFKTTTQKLQTNPTYIMQKISQQNCCNFHQSIQFLKCRNFNKVFFF